MEPIARPVAELRQEWSYSMSEPGTAVTRSAIPPVKSKLQNNWTLSDKSESTLQPKNYVYPRLACLEWCNCSPSRMLQVYTLELILADSCHLRKLDIAGFVAIRDFADGRRNYIFSREMADPLITISDNGVLLLQPTVSPRRAIRATTILLEFDLITISDNGVLLLQPTVSPRRAIRATTILLEFDLKMKRTGDSIDSYRQLIQGVIEHPWYDNMGWSRVNELSIRPNDDHLTPMMRMKLAMIMDGVEATVELRPLTLPPQGIDLRCMVRTGWIGDDIVLFDGRYDGDDPLLQFVVATELRGNMEIHLEGVCNGVSERWSVGFVPKFHALYSKAVDLSFAQISLSLAWSRKSIYPTYGPPDL